MFLEGLLGGITGATGALGKDIETKRAATVKAQQDKKDWLRDVMKGIMLQQMKPKSGDFDWQELLGDEDLSGIIDPGILEKFALGLKGGRKAKTAGPSMSRLSPGGINPSGGVITDY